MSDLYSMCIVSQESYYQKKKKSKKSFMATFIYLFFLWLLLNHIILYVKTMKYQEEKLSKQFHLPFKQIIK